MYRCQDFFQLPIRKAPEDDFTYAIALPILLATTRGKTGQVPSVSLAGVLDVQQSCRFRYRGDRKTRNKASPASAHMNQGLPCLYLRRFSVSFPYAEFIFIQKSNIPSRTSSGNVSIRLINLAYLHRIKSVRCSHCGVLRNERHTSTLVGLMPPSPTTILCRQQAFRMAIYWDRYHLWETRKW